MHDLWRSVNKHTTSALRHPILSPIMYRIIILDYQVSVVYFYCVFSRKLVQTHTIEHMVGPGPRTWMVWCVSPVLLDLECQKNAMSRPLTAFARRMSLLWVYQDTV